ncbi:zinc finger protein 346 isoform 1-T1 [Synchiropus picturatus]
MPSRNTLDKIEKKHKRWTEEDMERAFIEVKSGRYTVRKAAIQFGVPKSSLGDRVSGRVAPGRRSGPPRLLSPADEERLVECARYLSEHGFPLNKQQLVSLASAIYKRRNRRVAVSKLGQTWWSNFKRRQENNISIQPAERGVGGRAACGRKDAVDQFHRVMSAVVNSHQIEEKPHHIFSCSEAIFQLGRKKLILPKSVQLGSKLMSALNDHISVSSCFSAAGLDLPPFIVYAKSCPQGSSYKTQGPPEALYGSSDSGFVNTELFKKWFLRHFLLYAPSDRPLVLIFDGNKWPVHLEVLEVAWREKVVLLCLPPHCAHVLQPLDAGFFPLLKQHFLTLTGDGCGVSKNEFSRILKASYEAVKDDQGVRVVVDGFRKCGIYPVNAFTSNESDRMSAHSLSPVAGSVLSTSELDCQSVRDLGATRPSA